MTAIAVGFGARERLIGSLRQALAPPGGWTALALTAVMVATVGWSIDDASWVLGNAGYGDFLVSASIIATLVGFAGAMTGWPRWIVHFIGAVIAALVVPVLVGAVLVPHATPPQMFHATAVAMVNAWYDLAVLNLAVTPEIGHYLLVLGIIVWSIGQFAAFAVFRHRRPLDAVIVVGIVLLANMALTVKDQLFLLVVYSVAALLLLARAHAIEEHATWLQRRIGDASSVRSLYLRGGSAFVATAVLGSLVLTASASSAPLAGAWTGFGDRLIEISQSLQRYLPFGGATRPVGFGFGPSATISGSWSNDSSHAVTIHVPPGDTKHYYWRAATYDQFQGQAWAWTAPEAIARTSGQPALGDEADDPTTQGLRSELQFTVDPVGMRGPYVLSPQDVSTVDQDSKLYVVGDSGYFSALQLSNAGLPYAVTALVPVTRDVAGGRTQNRLRAAGQDYPDDVKNLYLQLPRDAMGPEATKLLADIVAEVPSKNPYAIAAAMESTLKRFKYDANVVGRCPPGQSVVECFATIREGYCQYYASTMVVLLREEGIPARLVQGFLPGSRDVETGTETILASSAHAWVEVYFPGYGWQLFDPTGGGRSQNAPLSLGEPVASATPGASASSQAVLPPRREEASAGPPGRGGGSTSANGPGAGLLIAVAVILLLAVGGLAFAAWQRGPRGEVSPESVWRGISRMAARFGFGPRPNQTVYEYAGTLGDVLPNARPALETVARAKVEVAYGRRELGPDALTTLRDAHRRLRVSLLRLAFLREERRRRRRRRL
jgi:transglutaminase-like putative cysteine protease